jgi:hypothetical protein
VPRSDETKGRSVGAGAFEGRKNFVPREPNLTEQPIRSILIERSADPSELRKNLERMLEPVLRVIDFRE